MKDTLKKPRPETKPAVAASAGKNEPPAAGSWDRFVWAIGVKESGNRAPDADGVIGTSLGNASGVEGSYGRYQTVASCAIDMLRKSKPLRDKYGFSDAEVAELNAHTESVRSYWDGMVKGDSKAAKKAGLDASDLDMARKSPEDFVEMHAEDWTKATGLPKEQLARMVGCIKFKQLIDQYKASHAAIADSKKRKAAAEEFYSANQKFFDSLGIKPKDLTAYMNKKCFAENLAGFQMAAAGGRHGHLSDAINAGGGVDFGAGEVAGLKGRVEKAAAKLGVRCPEQGSDHYYALCAKMHNFGRLSASDFESKDSITSQHGAGDDYAKAVLGIYHSGKG